jgi:hypothetical protein
VSSLQVVFITANESPDIVVLMTRQAESSRVRAPMRLKVFINLPNPSGRSTLWGLSAINGNEYQKKKNNVSGE